MKVKMNIIFTIIEEMLSLLSQPMKRKLIFSFQNMKKLSEIVLKYIKHLCFKDLNNWLLLFSVFHRMVTINSTYFTCLTHYFAWRNYWRMPWPPISNSRPLLFKSIYQIITIFLPLFPLSDWEQSLYSVLVSSSVK